MNLRDLGFDHWFEEYAGILLSPEQEAARVTAVDRGSFLVRNHHGETPAQLSGKRLFTAEYTTDMPCVGDWVSVQYYDSFRAAIIHDVFPRKTFLRRKCAGRNVDFQMIAANIDLAFYGQ